MVYIQRKDKRVTIFFTNNVITEIIFATIQSLSQALFYHKLTLDILHPKNKPLLNNKELTLVIFPSDNVAFLYIIIQFSKLQNKWFLLIVRENLLNLDFIQYFLVRIFCCISCEKEELIRKLKLLNIRKIKVVVLKFYNINYGLVFRSIPFNWFLYDSHLPVSARFCFIFMYSFLGNAKKNLPVCWY